MNGDCGIRETFARASEYGKSVHSEYWKWKSWSLESGIQVLQGIRNPANEWNLESRFHWQKNPESITWNPESIAWNPKFKIVLNYLTMSGAGKRFSYLLIYLHIYLFIYLYPDAVLFYQEIKCGHVGIKKFTVKNWISHQNLTNDIIVHFRSKMKRSSRIPSQAPNVTSSTMEKCLERKNNINKIVCKLKQSSYRHKQWRLEFQTHYQNHSVRTYLKWRRRSLKIRRPTHQYQFIAANMDSGVQRIVTCIITDSDVSTILKKLVNYMELFWKDGGMKRRFAWLVLAVDFFRVQKTTGTSNDFYKLSQIILYLYPMKERVLWPINIVSLQLPAKEGFPVIRGFVTKASRKRATRPSCSR